MFMVMLLDQIKKLRIRNSTVTINDVGLRSLKNWKMNRDKKIIFLVTVLLMGEVI